MKTEMGTLCLFPDMYSIMIYDYSLPYKIKEIIFLIKKMILSFISTAAFLMKVE